MAINDSDSNNNSDNFRISDANLYNVPIPSKNKNCDYKTELFKIVNYINRDRIIYELTSKINTWSDDTSTIKVKIYYYFSFQ